MKAKGADRHPDGSSYFRLYEGPTKTFNLVCGNSYLRNCGRPGILPALRLRRR